MKNYGYKVCYCELGKRRFVYRFLTYTYNDARNMLLYYLKYPPKCAKNNRELIKPIWKIIPISRREVKAGIWREPPFEGH